MSAACSPISTISDTRRILCQEPCRASGVWARATEEAAMKWRRYNCLKMTPDELELAKQAMEVAFSPVSDVCAKLFGQPADELGAMVTDFVRVFRFTQTVRLAKLLQDVKREAAALGVELGRVPDKTLLPLLEGASLEEDEDMHERWKWLLLNASDSALSAEVLPSFPDMLKQLTPQEARFLDRLYKLALESAELSGESRVPVVWTPIDRSELEFIYSELGLSKVRLPSWHGSNVDASDDMARFETIADDLIRLRLLRTESNTNSSSMSFGKVRAEKYFLTSLGARFVIACRTPSP
jgi:Abortive infection alpha